MDTGFYTGIILVAAVLGAMTVLVFHGRAIVERFHREGARPYARKHRKAGHD